MNLTNFEKQMIKQGLKLLLDNIESQFDDLDRKLILRKLKIENK